MTQSPSAFGVPAGGRCGVPPATCRGCRPFLAGTDDAQTPVVSGSTRLVVADDSAEMRTLIRDAVCGSRFEVDEAADGRQLFWMLERCRTSPDARHVVVVADVRMPIYSGLEVLEALDGAHCPFRFIIITSYPDDETRRRVERCGATLLPKPFTVAELRGVLARIGSCAETS